ncbi:MAG: heavy metal translocating P-type ATPase [Campylobacteraceae bacterium]|nr:heavy metal translocating P-type ATPase [Campylobacteraceae bacterium]
MSKKVKLNIAGMGCVNCANSIQKATKKIDGVVEVNVSFASSYGEFEIDDPKAESKIKEKIEKLGFEIATDYNDLLKKKQSLLKSLQNKLLISAILTAIIMFLHMGFEHSFLNSLAQFILTTIVVFFCGSHFFTHAKAALQNKNFDMNVLVALGAGSAYLYSTLVFLFPSLVPPKFNYVYFESAAMIITFISFGKLLEEHSKFRANDYIKTLLNLTPKVALLLKKDGTTQEILASNLKVGDIILVKNGTTIPGDGEIIHGGAEIDSSILTGESLPVYKKVGDLVNAGCLNTNGVINVKIISKNHETLLSRITKLLSEAAAKKMPISRVADRVANVFVPTVIILAVITFLVWWYFGNPYYGMMCAMSVLLISCPCALGLATPIAIVSALSNLAKNGVLVKNPEVMEILKETKTVIFDKTGTLTKGEISVYKTNLNDDELSKVAGLESLNEHLIAKAIVKFAKEKNVKFTKFEGEFENIIGKGLKTSNLIVGNKTLFDENGVKFSENEVVKFLDNGFGVVLVAIDGKYRGYIALSDTLRESSKELISTLDGVKTVMLTGDNKKVATHIALNLGIENVYSDVLPEEKLSVVKKYKEEGITIFVGDGVNDALPLKEADCGVAMSSGSDIAKGAGDILLVNNDLNGVKRVLEMSDKTMRVIKQNLFWAFFYNALCIPVAAGLLYPGFGILLNPAYAALAMGFSSITVVLNSLRLYRGKV